MSVLSLRSSSNMIHLDIIKYILNPLLNWDDSILLQPTISVKVSKNSLSSPTRPSLEQSTSETKVTEGNFKKKHYSHIHLTEKKLTFMFDDDNIKFVKHFDCRVWYKNGLFDRKDKDKNGLTLPAIIWRSGNKNWCLEGCYNRIDKDEFGATMSAIEL